MNRGPEFLFSCTWFIYLLRPWVFFAVRRLLSSCHQWASPGSGLSCCRPQAPGRQASVAADPGLESTGPVVVTRGLGCSEACGIFLDQGSSPCPLRWQVDSNPVDHRGIPLLSFLIGHICLLNSLVRSLCRMTLTYSPYIQSLVLYLILGAQ